MDRILTELKPLFDSLDELPAHFTAQEQAAINRYLRLAAQQLTEFAAGLGHDDDEGVRTEQPKARILG
ncbi:hypothetical protein LTH96_04190 [Nesterenkonia sp. LB17]|uniref:hypothetical protein n=1 Tax=Nesterenkonia sp. LB17 TaxID=2901230 RepID=UPI001F4C645E|nr:hypothetical protein [Nesterenkonia sp. LB17]MCH8564937.1 hypothetical protein [Nesterenkonia sp. LB17]